MSKLASTSFFIFSLLCVVWVSSGLLAPSYSQQGTLPPTAPPPKMPAGQAPPSTDSKPATMKAVESEIMGNLNQVESFSYDPTGRRDPFRPFGSEVEKVTIPGGGPIDLDSKVAQPLTDLQNFDLAQLKLIAISWGTKKPSAVVKDPAGKYHVVRKYSRVGKGSGFVALIREGEIVIVEPAVVDGVSTAITRVMLLNK